ncbi:MAG: hypothetical protein HY529_06760, partial [Chloroflexi bacterium]|nr:hypothetical protein [Chloroflexota bacterium]
MKKKIFYVLTAAVLALSLVLPAVTPALAASADITTNQDKYHPGETMTITGSNFGASESVRVEVYQGELKNPNNVLLQNHIVTADGSGGFTDSYTFASDSKPGTYNIKATGLTSGLVATERVVDPPAKANLDQARNGSATSPTSPIDWVNGNAGASNSHYMEGFSIPYRVVFTDLPTGSSNPITLTIGFDIKNSSKNAIDFITHYNRLEPHAGFGHAAETITPTAGVTGISSNTTTFAIPAPSSTGSPVPGQPTAAFNSLPAAEREMTLFGGHITGMAYVSQGDLTAAQSETQISVTFWLDNPTAVLSWGGHIGQATVWGAGNSAGGISGSPYHTRLVSWTGGTNLGNTDRSLSAEAVVQPATIVVVKNTVGGDNTFNYSATGNGMPSSFNITTSGNSGNQTFAGLVAGSVGGSRSVTETVPAGWTQTGLVVTSALGTSTFSTSGNTATVSNLTAGDTVTITYTDTGVGSLTIIKNTTGGDGTFTYTVSGPSVVGTQTVVTSGGTGN